MKKHLFEDLVASVKEAGKILRGEAEPARRFVFKEDVRRSLKNPTSRKTPKSHS
jgi:hypothetical protein